MSKLERFLYIFGAANIVLQIMFFLGNLPKPFMWNSSQGQTVIFTMSIFFAFLFVNSR